MLDDRFRASRAFAMGRSATVAERPSPEVHFPPGAVIHASPQLTSRFCEQPPLAVPGREGRVTRDIWDGRRPRSTLRERLSFASPQKPRHDWERGDYGFSEQPYHTPGPEKQVRPRERVRLEVTAEASSLFCRLPVAGTILIAVFDHRRRGGDAFRLRRRLRRARAPLHRPWRRFRYRSRRHRACRRQAPT